MLLLSLVFNVRFFSDYEEKLESGGDGLQSLPVCADNAFASAVEAGMTPACAGTTGRCLGRAAGVPDDPRVRGDDT